jgi:ATP-dependent Clp protease protease subunit
MASSKQFQSKLSRIVTLGEINSETANDIIRLIYEINEEDGEKAQAEPIKLIINSLGGELYSGMALVDVIEASATPVYTICHGAAMSMGLVVFAAGRYRVASKYATFMYHESSYPLEDKLQSHKQELKEADRTDKLCDDYLLSKTKFDKKQLASVRKTRGEWYLDVETAYKYGLVDEII